MYVIHVCLKVGIVTNEMFPKSSLPNATFTTIGANLGKPFDLRQAFGKSHLDQSLPGCEVGITLGKLQNAMHVFRQHHPAMNAERMTRLHGRDDFSL